MKENVEGSIRPPRLSAAEWIVMKPFWVRGELAARDVYAALPPSHNWAYKTVKNMLARLVKKGVLEYTQVGNSYLYRARFSRDEMVRKAVKDFSKSVLDGALQPFLLNFFDDREPSEEEISALRDQIERFKDNNPDPR